MDTENIPNDAEGGHAWRTQPHFDPERPGLAETPTPTIEEMAANPGGGQTLYTVTYERVGRRGGRNGTPPPPPFNIWTTGPEHLAEQVLEDCKRYLLSSGVEVMVDLEEMRGSILTGFREAGTFTLAKVHGVDA
jgi:hypothetical protein